MQKMIRMNEFERKLWVKAQSVPESERLMALKEVIWTAPRPTRDEELIYIVECSDVPESIWRILLMAQSYGYAEKAVEKCDQGSGVLQVDGSIIELLLEAVQKLLGLILENCTGSGEVQAQHIHSSSGVEQIMLNRRDQRLIELDCLGV